MQYPGIWSRGRRLCHVLGHEVSDAAEKVMLASTHLTDPTTVGEFTLMEILASYASFPSLALSFTSLVSTLASSQSITT